MTMMASVDARRSQYIREAVLSATPVRLLTMLYDRLLLDLNRAEAEQEQQNWGSASEQLLHAQAILSELSSSLKVELWDGAEGLRALYTYVSTALIAANTRKDVARTREGIALLEPLRTAWHEAAERLAAENPSTDRAVGLHIA
jgi:flagellar secretion chaperone FliS